MTQNIVWLRSETKPHEHRTPLIPEHAKKLLDDKHTVVVERSSTRIIKDNEYLDVGCEIVPSGSWRDAPLEAIILGIKELPYSDEPIKHKHVYFSHAYKGQEGARNLLNRYKQGHGVLYDLEYLNDKKGKRACCFSYWAGVAGCAVTLLLWIQKCKQNNKPLSIPEFYPSESALIGTLTRELGQIEKPSSLVIGASGQCAKGVLYLLKMVNLEATKWFRSDTAGASRHSDIMQYNLLFNCVYLTDKIMAPFITNEHLSVKGNLSIIADISCDPTSPLNPLPIYDEITTFQKPTVRICDTVNNIDVMSIDHLPSFLPNESSYDFSAQLLPYLQRLLQFGFDEPSWKQAAESYYKAISSKVSDIA